MISKRLSIAKLLSCLFLSTFCVLAGFGCSMQNADNPEIWDEISSSLKDPRYYAMVRREADVPYLARALSEPSWVVRYNAAQDLRKLKSKARDAVPQLVACFNDRHAKVSRMCFKAVQDIGVSGEKDVQALAALLSSPSAQSRSRAIGLLSRVGDDARYAAAELIAALGSYDAGLRRQVEQVILPLSKEAKDKELFRLGVFNSDDGKFNIDVQLLKALSNSNLIIRQRAALLLGKRSVQEALPTLEQMFESRSRDDRLAAAWGLAFLHAPGRRDDVLQVLRQSMQLPDSEVRDTSAEALKAMGDVETLRSYQTARVQAQAAAAAKDRESKEKDRMKKRHVASSQISATAHKVRVRLVTEYVERTTPGQIERWKTEIPAVKRSLHAIDADQRQIAVANLMGMAFYVPEALPVLVDALQSQDARVRKAAAIALGQLRAHAAVSSLVGLLEDEEVRDSAAAALLEIGSASGRTAVEAHREVLDMTKVQAEQARIQRGKRLETLPGVGVAEARELCRLLLIDAGLSGSNLEPSVESCVQETKAQY